MKCLKDLNDIVMGTLRRQNELFDFKVEEEIEYLALHVKYVKMHLVCCIHILCVY